MELVNDAEAFTILYSGYSARREKGWHVHIVLLGNRWKLFRRIKNEVVAPLGVDFQHIDMFPIRETNQKIMLGMVQRKRKNKDKRLNLNSFGNALNQVFIEMLNYVSPDYLMINNAGASHMLLAHFGVDTETGIDDETGCYFINISNKEIPVLCSGMLSGQRALDICTRERLFWHLGNLIKKSKKHR